MKPFAMNKKTYCTSEYKENERTRQRSLLGSNILEGAEGNGYYIEKGELKVKDYILKPEDSLKCLYSPIRKDALKYFENYDIAWWRQYEDRYFPTGHLLSSQSHCLNHLFHIRKDPDAILAIIQPIGESAGIHFDKVLPSFIDTHEAYFDNTTQKPVSNSNFISFEFVCDNILSLGESREKRGSKCTSVDALVYAQAGEEKWLVPIEWKYTEVYSHDKEYDRDRYASYFHKTSRLSGWVDNYEIEPFYELSRQTLLMENLIINKPLVGKISTNYPQKPLQADNFLHIVVVPDGNIELRKDLEKFRSTIKENSQKYFCTIDPQELLNPLKNSYPDLLDYLNSRYWNVESK